MQVYLGNLLIEDFENQYLAKLGGHEQVNPALLKKAVAIA
jgi:hypothetical protein